MENSIQQSIDEMSARIDALIKQVHDLNEGLRKNKLAELNTEILEGTEAAAYLKVTKQFLQRLRDAGEIKFYQRGFLIRYKRADLDKWLNAHQVGR